MKTITYNPETHVLVPREPTRAMCSAALAFDDNKPLNDWGKIVSITYEETYSAMLAAAPQPESNPNWCAGCSPDNCSGCGDKPAAYTTPQPGRVAELEAALKVARAGIEWALSNINCEPLEWSDEENADAHREAIETLAKINEVLHD